jgi:hypothetical protein
MPIARRDAMPKKSAKTFGEMTRAEMKKALEEQLTDELLEDGVKWFNKSRRCKCRDCGGKLTGWTTRNAHGELRITIDCLRCRPQARQ